MRLFTGIRPSDDFRAALAVLQERLRAAGITGRYLDPSNLHMTLEFIGEWPEDITRILPPVGHPFTITLAHPGIFPEAKVLWAGVEKSEELNCLAKKVRDSLAGNGIPFDPKGFNPHITLVRKPVIPDGVDLSGIEIPKASMVVDEICLYRSERGENGMVYTVIGSTGDRI
ncbi:MAG: RNA 2',3'-cyclic phosphodiesterase [Clostridia bacterium]|nr:RNA 2',3'-cyclic phosphodiesterase [Clostridia bacterium]